MSPIASWPRAPLSAEERQLIGEVRWNSYPVEMVVAIAEAWNAGMSTDALGVQVHRSPYVLRNILDRLARLGVQIRRAGEPAFPTNRPRAKRLADPTHLRRLRRLAEFDAAFRLPLAIYERTHDLTPLGA